MRRTAETYAGFMPETWLQRTIRGASPCPVPRPLTSPIRFRARRRPRSVQDAAGPSSVERSRHQARGEGFGCLPFL